MYKESVSGGIAHHEAAWKIHKVEAIQSMNASRIIRSTVGQKLFMGVSGILLILFLIMHLSANLLLFVPDGGIAFNMYSHKLKEFGPLLTLVRVGLAAVFLVHIVSGIRVYRKNLQARRSRYAVMSTKGGPSKMGTASLWMARTGLVLLIFVPIHVAMFSMGPYYGTVIDGTEMRDLYLLVVEKFNQAQVAFPYSAVMLLLGLHLRHGFWSALQSLGAMTPRWSPVIYSVGLIFSIIMALGFFVLPLYIYFAVPLPQLAGA